MGKASRRKRQTKEAEQAAAVAFAKYPQLAELDPGVGVDFSRGTLDAWVGPRVTCFQYDFRKERGQRKCTRQATHVLRMHDDEPGRVSIFCAEHAAEMLDFLTQPTPAGWQKYYDRIQFQQDVQELAEAHALGVL